MKMPTPHLRPIRRRARPAARASATSAAMAQSVFPGMDIKYRDWQSARSRGPCYRGHSRALGQDHVVVLEQGALCAFHFHDGLIVGDNGLKQGLTCLRHLGLGVKDRIQLFRALALLALLD